MKRTRLRAKDVETNLAEYGCKVDKKDIIEIIEEKHKVLCINMQPSFFWYADKWIPTLKYLQSHPHALKTITIDMGAVKFIVNGADLMRPGIADMDPTITKAEVITIIDQKNKKPIAIGIPLYEGLEIQSLTAGKVVKNIHYVGDNLWLMEAA